jgi:cyclophilin family peptidyl-prolyl cis-trans isomerase
MTGVIATTSTASAQGSSVTRADSALVRRILSAEDRRDSTAAALSEGGSSPNELVRVIARRALGRIRDPRFAARDSLPPLRAPMTWPEPAWRLRFRALTAKSDCAAILAGLSDSTWQVRLHAADLVTNTCAGDGAIVKTLEQWADLLPAATARRARDSVSWHAAAHAIVALAHADPIEARRRLPAVAAHSRWQVRMYAARAAGVLSDTTRLRALARDPSDNVKEQAIDALAKLNGHADDKIYLAVIDSPNAGAQAVRAAALALAGSPDPSARSAANAAFARWVVKDNASARDARVALLAAAGRPASDDRPPTTQIDLPSRAVELALGAEARVRVTMAPEYGGGSFVVRMRGDVAPIMVARVLALVRSGYYDGYGWHRVEPDFVIQGPSPGDNEYVGYSRYFRDELGTVPHTRGTVGMSTRGHDSGDAQWFVNLRDNLRLGRDYTVFGEVVEGIDVVDRILEGDVIARMEEIH